MNTTTKNFPEVSKVQLMTSKFFFQRLTSPTNTSTRRIYNPFEDERRRLFAKIVNSLSHELFSQEAPS